MQVTIGERQSGKTTKLIKRSAAEGSYILAVNKHQASAIFKQASEMGDLRCCISDRGTLDLGRWMACKFRIP